MTADIFLTSRFGPARSIDLAKVARRAGLGGVWLAEHYFIEYGKCPSATVLASAILAATDRITVATAACVMSARDPVRLGLEASMLRELYGERFQLGVARGGPWRENELLGRGMEYYRTGFPDWLDRLREHYDGPIRVAATSLSTVEVAAARGMPLLLGVENTDAAAAGMVRHWAELAGSTAGGVRAGGAADGVPAGGAAGSVPIAGGAVGSVPLAGGAASGVPEGDGAAPGLHARVAIAAPQRDHLAGWLRGIGDPSRDLAAHLEHLMTARPGPVDGVGKLIWMVEATESARATAALIERLQSVC